MVLKTANKGKGKGKGKAEAKSISFNHQQATPRLRPPPCSVQTMRDVFESKDCFTLDRDSMQKFLLEFGFSSHKAANHATNFFKKADAQGSGWVDVDDFINEFIRMQTYIAIREVVCNMAAYDADHSGDISRQELQAVLVVMLGIHDGAKKAASLFQTIHGDLSGSLSKEELLAWYKKEDARVRLQRQALPKAKQAAHQRGRRRKEKKVLARAKTEFLSFFSGLPLGTELSEEQLGAVWQRFDADKNGYIDSTEMVGLLGHLIAHMKLCCTALVTTTLEAYGLSAAEIALQISKLQAGLARLEPELLSPRFMELLDLDSDGHISLPEFLLSFNTVLVSAQRTLDSHAPKKPPPAQDVKLPEITWNPPTSI